MIEGPTAEQERDHLAKQCAELLCENKRLRAVIQSVSDHPDVPRLIRVVLINEMDAAHQQKSASASEAWDLLAKRLYIADCDNHPTIYYGFPTWEELAETQRAEWRKRAARQHQIS